MHNSIRFDPRFYGSESIVRESRIVWFPINTEMRESIPIQIQKTEVNLQDLDIDLDQFTEFQDMTPFKPQRLPS